MGVASPPADTRIEPSPLEPEARARRRWRDLALVGVLALLCFVLPALPAALRIPLGALCVLVGPGYAMVAVIFPDERHVDNIERIALALALSLSQVAAGAFVLDRLGALDPTTIRLSTGLLTALLTCYAAVRRAKAPTPAGDAGRKPPATRARRFTQAIVVANLMVAALAFVLTVGSATPAPTEFYVLGREGLLSDYPRTAEIGEPVTLRVGIHQGSVDGAQYTVSATTGDRQIATLGPVAIERGGRWESDLQLSFDNAAPDQDLLIELRRSGDDKPYRTLRLFLDVEPRRPA